MVHVQAALVLNGNQTFANALTLQVVVNGFFFFSPYPEIGRGHRDVERAQDGGERDGDVDRDVALEELAELHDGLGHGGEQHGPEPGTQLHQLALVEVRL